MRTGLFFGSFNPIHLGHLIIGQFLLNQSDLEEIWFIVSPQNPLKSNRDLMDENDRFEMVKLATEEHPKFKALDIEFHMPTPSYTAYTMRDLREKHKDRDFVLIMGTDNLQHFDKWKDPETILLNHEIYAYLRDGFPGGEYAKNQRVKVYKAPALQISASYIRGLMRMKRSIHFLVPPKVEDYLIAMEAAAVSG